MQTTERLPISQKNKSALQKISRTTNKPVIFHIRKAISNYLEELHDLEVAKKRLSDKTDTVISSKKMRELLGI